MMKSFCTTGPIDTGKNYYLPRTALIAEGLKKIDDWRYFTIFAPRQSGKTTCFQFLIEAIRVQRPDYFPVWVSFESFGDISGEDFLELFQEAVQRRQKQSYRFVRSFPRLFQFFQQLISAEKKELVLIIDEVEGLQNQALVNNFLHLIRSIYHERKEMGLRSVILTGVSNISGILQSNASPFNIADQLHIPYFSCAEVFELLAQHEGETGQLFDPDVKEGIFSNTAGQPGLVNALARDIVEKKLPGGEKVTREAFLKTMDDFTRIYLDNNISNIVAKAKEYPQLMKDILFGGEVSFNAYDETIKYLFVHGVISDSDGYCCIPVPIYKKALYTCFQPLTNGEKDYFKSPVETYKKYLDEKGRLDTGKLMRRYIEYVKNRGNIIFSRGKAGEGVYHYNLDAFFSTYAEFAGAKCLVETPLGGGRVDLLLIQNEKTDIIEIKLYDADIYEKSRNQLITYLQRSGLPEGHLVMFSQYHQDESYEKVTGEDYIIHQWVIPVHRPTPASASRGRFS